MSKRVKIWLIHISWCNVTLQPGLLMQIGSTGEYLKEEGVLEVSAGVRSPKALSVLLQEAAELIRGSLAGGDLARRSQFYKVYCISKPLCIEPYSQGV